MGVFLEGELGYVNPFNLGVSWTCNVVHRMGIAQSSECVCHIDIAQVRVCITYPVHICNNVGLR